MPRGCRVPRLLGLPRATAVKRLRAAGCGKAKITTRKAKSRSERRRIGRVVSQRPSAGRRAAVGATPRLVVLRR
jgi:beta-lactam-binding protein with PASTA domain